MLSPVAKSFALSSMFLLSAGSLWAQADAKVTEAIELLGSESPAVRAKARTTLFRMGKKALNALRRAIDAPDDVLPEHLFVIAEDLGRRRRSVRFKLNKDFGYRSWRVSWFPGGQQLGILRKLGGRVRMLDAALEPTDETFGEKSVYFSFGPLGKRVAFNTENREVVVVERKTGRRVLIPVSGNPGMVFSPDGRHIATGGYGRSVDLWSAADGSVVRKFHVEGAVGGLTPVFSPNGKLLVVGNRNDKTWVFDVASGKVLHVLDRKMTQQPVFSPDGTLLAIGYVDGKIGIWNVANGKLKKMLDGRVKEVFTLAWSQDGEFLASAGLSGPIVIWSGKHLAELCTLEPGSGRTFHLAWRPDGKMLVAAGNETTRAWTVESKK